MTASAVQSLSDRLGQSRAGEPAWLAARRREGHVLFQRLGLPGKRVEEWKWSDLRRAVTDAKPVSGVMAQSLPPISDAIDISLRNGHLGPLPEALPAGLTIASLREDIVRVPDLVNSLGAVAPALHSIAGLNMALWGDGLVVRVAPGARIAEPLHIANEMTDGAGVHTRLLLLLGEGAELVVVESQEGGAELTSFIGEARLARGARLTYLRRDRLNGAAQHVSALFADVAANARYDGVTVSEGAGLARRETHVILSGEGAQANLTGALVLSADRQSDETVTVRHQAPACESRQGFRAVAGAGARAVVQGRIEVGVGAQKTDARQNVKGLLLAPRAEIDAKPELEIFADDVACAHGTAIGELDPAQLFYLRARGIPEAQARALLVEAFLAVAFDGVEDERDKSIANDMVAAWSAREHGR